MGNFPHFLPTLRARNGRILGVNKLNNHPVFPSLPGNPVLQTTVLHKIQLIPKLPRQFIHVLNKVLETLQLNDIGTEIPSNFNDPLPNLPSEILHDSLSL